VHPDGGTIASHRPPAGPDLFTQRIEMTMLRMWHALIYLGDGAVLLPCSVLLFAWLIADRTTRRAGWWWLLATLLVSGGVALSKMLYMAWGWHPAGWNFIGLSGHAALSFMLFPVAAALVGSRSRPVLRVSLVALGGCLALAISISSWVLGDHSPAELVLGGLWGALVAAAFLAIIWRQVMEAPQLHKWAVVSLLLLAGIAYRHEFPSNRVLGWVALHLSDRSTIYTRSDLGPHAQLPNAVADGRNMDPPAAHAHRPSSTNP
jgi:hypothetical protein